MANINRQGKSRSSNRLYFLGLQNHCGWWLQPWKFWCSLLGRYAMTNIGNIKKQKHHFAIKIHIFKAIVFPADMYRLRAGHIYTWKKAECWRTDACGAAQDSCESLVLPRISNQSILKETNPENSLEGLMLKLKLQYFGHLMWRSKLSEKTDARKDWRQKEKVAAVDKIFR